MANEARMTSEALDQFFEKAYVKDSISAGIMKSNRTNTSTP